MDTTTPIVTLRSQDGNVSYTLVATGLEVVEKLMTKKNLEAVSGMFEKKQGGTQACDWRWDISYDGKGTITVRNPLQEKRTLETSHGSLTKAYAQHLHTTLEKEKDRQKLCALAIEYRLKTPRTSVSELRTSLRTYFGKEKHVETEMKKFFAKPSDEGIENIT